MKKSNMITILFPTFFMTILMILFSFSNETKGVDFKGLLIISLIFIFPLLFLLQGIKSSINNTNIIMSIGVSIFTFIVFMIIYLNSSAIMYIFIYLVFGAIGYILTNYIMKNKPKYKSGNN